MKKNNFDLTVGKSIFNRLEDKVNSGGTSFNLFAEEKAADLLLQSPYFVDELRNRGVLKQGEHHSKYIFVFRSNLACQRFGVMQGKSDLLVTTYAADRAKAVIEYLIRNKPEMIKENSRRGVSQYDMYHAFRSIFLKDSLQTDYISGMKLSPDTEIIAGVAVNKRLIKSSTGYGEMLKSLNINPNDNTELRDVVRETDFRSVVLDHYKQDTFYLRRDGAIISKHFSVTDGYTNSNFDVETGNLFLGGDVNGKKKLTEKMFIHLVESLGLNRQKLAKMLVG